MSCVKSSSSILPFITLSSGICFFPLKHLNIIFLFLYALSLNAQLDLYTESRNMMGTKFQMIVYGDSTSAAAAAKLGFEEIKRLEKIFSDYDPESEVSQLNKNYKWQMISKELYEVTQYAEQLNKDSKGIFDIKIGRVINIWKEAIKNQVMPDDKVLQTEIKKNRKLKLKKKKGNYYIKLNKNVQLDYGGIAKGYAVDRAFQILYEQGFKSLLIDGGGDLRMGDSPPDRDFWIIDTNNKIENEYLLLKNTAIASSGDTYQNIQINNVRFSHIVHPQISQGRNSKLVSVIADQCMVADALATTLFLIDNPEALKKQYQYKARIMEANAFSLKDF